MGRRRDRGYAESQQCWLRSIGVAMLSHGVGLCRSEMADQAEQSSGMTAAAWQEQRQELQTEVTGKLERRLQAEQVNRTAHNVDRASGEQAGSTSQWSRRCRHLLVDLLI